MPVSTKQLTICDFSSDFEKFVLIIVDNPIL